MKILIIIVQPNLKCFIAWTVHKTARQSHLDSSTGIILLSRKMCTVYFTSIKGIFFLRKRKETLSDTYFSTHNMLECGESKEPEPLKRKLVGY